MRVAGRGRQGRPWRGRTEDGPWAAPLQPDATATTNAVFYRPVPVPLQPRPPPHAPFLLMLLEPCSFFCCCFWFRFLLCCCSLLWPCPTLTHTLTLIRHPFLLLLPHSLPWPAAASCVAQLAPCVYVTRCLCLVTCALTIRAMLMTLNILSILSSLTNG